MKARESQDWLPKNYFPYLIKRYQHQHWNTYQLDPSLIPSLFSLKTVECNFLKCGLCSQIAQLLIMASPLDSSKTIDKPLNIFKPLFSHLLIWEIIFPISNVYCKEKIKWVKNA